MSRMVCVLALLAAVSAFAAPDESWKLPLVEKERALEENCATRHNILGLYPSQVEVPLDGSPVDNTTLGIGNIAHSVCWTSNYLAGASYRYRYLKDSGASEEEVAAAKARADELFEAVYRCQLVTGRRGLQARGYAIGHGESYEERWDDETRDEWHQGEGEFSELRWRGDPSHHNYSDATHGLVQYYDLAAEGAQKERAREAIDALVGYWVDNDLKIAKLDTSREPTPILGFTDGHTFDTRIMMAIAGAKAAHYATGGQKYLDMYNRLLDQYGVRQLTEFKTEKGFDDAEHVFCHLDYLFRIEKDPELLRAYRAIADGIWANHKDDAQSLFTYIYYKLAPDAPDKDKALKEALYSLQTWPTDMTIQPRMSSLDKSLKPPYPVYAAAWDNEYIWKGNLLRGDGWFSRIVTGVSAPAEDPVVLYAFDTNGDLYQSRDGAATAAGWRPIDQGLRTPVRALDAGPKVRMLAVACDDGFYLSTTGGYTWESLDVPGAGSPQDIQFDAANGNVLYAIGSGGVYRSRDYGQKFLGTSWECLTETLPTADTSRYTVAQGAPGRIYAVVDGVLFTRRLDEEAWGQGGVIGLGEYGRPYPWLAVDPANPDHAVAACSTEYGGMGRLSLLQATFDGGMSWTNDMRTIYEKFSEAGMLGLVSLLVQGEVGKPVFLGPETLLMGSDRGVLKSTDGGKTWQPKKDGLDIPIAKTVFAPRNGGWAFAGTPAGLYVSKDQGETWEPANLVLQWIKNTRRELGGAAYIDAYWRGRMFGFITDEMIDKPYQE